MLWLSACTPLTTPEEAQAFLAAMRDKSHERFEYHQPPSNLSSAGMDAWYQKQRQSEKEMRQRRREAEQLLRGYRGGRESLGFADYRSPRASIGAPFMTPDATTSTPLPMTIGSVQSETLDDPHSFKQFLEQQTQSDEQGPQDEKKVEEQNEAQMTMGRDVPEVTVWRYFISNEPGSDFKPEAGRYHL